MSQIDSKNTPRIEDGKIILELGTMPECSEPSYWSVATPDENFRCTEFDTAIHAVMRISPTVVLEVTVGDDFFDASPENPAGKNPFRTGYMTDDDIPMLKKLVLDLFTASIRKTQNIPTA